MWEEYARALQQIIQGCHCCVIMVLSAVRCILILQDCAPLAARYAGILLFLGRSPNMQQWILQQPQLLLTVYKRADWGLLTNANHPPPARVSKGLSETMGLLSAETLIRSSSLIRERNVGK